MRYRLQEDGDRLNFDRLLHLLSENAEFCQWLSGLITDSRFDAVFWECPPLSSYSLPGAAEFALITAPGLATANADPSPFADIFHDCGAAEVVQFTNLGGDAQLISPQPAPETRSAAHLKSWLEQASTAQQTALWHDVGSFVAANVDQNPRWLSTSGLGVYWTHIRWDSQPKYYQHRPYRNPNYLSA